MSKPTIAEQTDQALDLMDHALCSLQRTRITTSVALTTTAPDQANADDIRVLANQLITTLNGLEHILARVNGWDPR